MSGGAVVFMSLSWIAVLSLTFWSFARLMGSHKRSKQGEEGV